MGDRRLAYDPIVNKINNKSIESRLPEGSETLLSLPTLLSGPTLQMDVSHLASNKHMSMPAGIQQGLNVVISKGEQRSTDERSLEAIVAPALTVHLPAAPMQPATLCQPLNEGLPLIEAAPKRCNLCVVNMKPLLSDLHSSKIEAAQKQSEALKTPSAEGKGRYLERAVAYIRERISRRAFACDAFVPRAQKKPPDKMVDSGTAG
ncbi:hypothetical protein AX14_010494 [Amanita brunnescens Koide BX004]|nr:hypothetical protein AX14_010494 [Amanita brunnescens Koide BX004]